MSLEVHSCTCRYYNRLGRHSKVLCCACSTHLIHLIDHLTHLVDPRVALIYLSSKETETWLALRSFRILGRCYSHGAYIMLFGH